MINKCFEFTLKYISRYPKTEKELSIHLFQKGFSSEDVQQTIKKLKEIGYINDEKFAQSYINSELINKGRPQIIIKQKLMQKGIDSYLIDKLLKENDDDIRQGECKKIKKEIEVYKKKGIDGFDIIQKLMRKGYKLDDIKLVIQKNNHN